MPWRTSPTSSMNSSSRSTAARPRWSAFAAAVPAAPPEWRAGKSTTIDERLAAHRLLYSTVMKLFLACALLFLASACTGGQESKAADEQLPQKNGITTTQQQPAAPVVDAAKELKSISNAIPLYAGAKYRDDLTRHDEVMIRNQFGPQAEVYTLASDDSYPQIYHYYTTYLAQFRAYTPQ